MAKAEKEKSVWLRFVRDGREFFNLGWESMELILEKGELRPVEDEGGDYFEDNPRPESFSAPLFFLLGQSVELWLKAILLSNGKTIDELKTDFGHDLILLSEVVDKIDHAPNIDRDQRDVLEQIAEMHKNRDFIYDSPRGPLPDGSIRSLYKPFNGFGEEVERYIHKKYRESNAEQSRAL